MTQPPDPPSVAESAPRRRRRWPAVLMGLLSLLLLGWGWLHATSMDHECCAIDCEAYPDVCAQNAREHAQWERYAENMAVAGFLGSAVTMGAAVFLFRRR